MNCKALFFIKFNYHFNTYNTYDTDNVLCKYPLHKYVENKQRLKHKHGTQINPQFSYCTHLLKTRSAPHTEIEVNNFGDLVVPLNISIILSKTLSYFTIIIKIACY